MSYPGPRDLPCTTMRVTSSSRPSQARNPNDVAKLSNDRREQLVHDTERKERLDSNPLREDDLNKASASTFRSRSGGPVMNRCSDHSSSQVIAEWRD